MNPQTLAASKSKETKMEELKTKRAKFPKVAHPLDVHDPLIPIICKFCFGHEDEEEQEFFLVPKQLDCLKCSEPFGSYHWPISTYTLICRSCAAKRGLCQRCQCKREKIDIVNAWSVTPADEQIGIDNGLARPTGYADIIIQKKKESWFTATTSRKNRQGSRVHSYNLTGDS